jgi:menaquinone-dependent protoporphyrinogen oxidase
MNQGTKISRRRFLVLAGTAAAAGTAALACGGLGGQKPEVEFVEPSCGTESDTQGRILVAYASQYGSTGGVAEAIAQVLCEAGMAVAVKLVTNVTDLSEYRAVIVGSPVQNDAWRPEAISFVEANRDLLSQRPVAYFLTCMTLGLDPRPEGRERMSRALEQVWEQIPEVVPMDKGLFAGTIPLGYLSPGIGGVYQVLGQQEGDFPGIDFRDWDAIRSWAEGLCPALVDAQSYTGG